MLLLSAIALHQVGYGMWLVSAFSLGLASVLVVIGLAVVYAYQGLERLPNVGILHRYFPIASAAATIGVGVVLSACAVI